MKDSYKNTLMISAVVALVLLLSAGTAHAYVGPGPGLTVLGALWAVIAAAVLAVLAIVRYPLRYLIRRIKGKGAGQAGETPDASRPGSQEPGDRE